MTSIVSSGAAAQKGAVCGRQKSKKRQQAEETGNNEEEEINADLTSPNTDGGEWDDKNTPLSHLLRAAEDSMLPGARQDCTFV